MAVQQENKNQIALNVTRTRVTVLSFNLTIIALMLGGHDLSDGHVALGHLSSSVALFVGFCMTLLGLWWLLSSQNMDAVGLSQPLPYTLGAVTTYFSLSQTVTAFMHVFFIAAETSLTGVVESKQNLFRLETLGDAGLLLLFMAGVIWVLVTYIAPLLVCLRAPLQRKWRWGVVAYYIALQIPIYWIYARVWQLEYIPEDQPANMLSLFAIQFVQPLLWFR